MGQKKLIKFAAIKEYQNVLEYPLNMPGNWANFFKNQGADEKGKITLELACGRGEYTVGLARLNAKANFIGVDIKGNRIWKGATIAIKERLNNVAFLRTQIDQINQYFTKEEVSEIWITFPDPQVRLSKAKKRLTHPKYLRMYQQFLQKGGIVHLKTDSPNLFQFTMAVIQLFDLPLLYASADLYNDPNRDPRSNIKTYYEGLNIANSKCIHYIQFQIDKEMPEAKDEQLKEIIAQFEVTETHDAKRERSPYEDF